MKKLILTSIIILTTLNAFATNCVQSIFDYIKKTYDEEITDGMVIDSIYHYYQNDNHFAEYYNNKYHWTGKHLDSVTYYYKFHTSDEWHIDVDRWLDSIHTEITHEGNFTHYISTGGYPSTEELVYIEKDSINRVLTFIGEKDDHTPHEAIYVLRNDTLFATEENGKDSYIIVNDSINKNKCYEKGDKSNSYSDLLAIDEFEMKGDTVVRTETRLGDDPSTQISFFVPLNKSSSIIIRRSRPTIKRQEAKPFDLLGRPARGKYTVKVLK